MKTSLLLPVQGMRCQKCVTRLTDALQGQPGVAGAQVDLDTASARIDYDPALTGPDLLAAAVVEAGFVVAEAGVGSESEDRSSVASVTQGSESIQLPLFGMSCSNCARSIEKGVNELDGTLTATVNFALENISVTWNPAQIELEDIRACIRDLGFRAGHAGGGNDSGQLTFTVSGMHCASCARTVEDKLGGLPGVRQVRVNLADDRASVSFDPRKLGPEDLFEAVRQAGYNPVADDTVERQVDEGRTQLRWLLFSASLSLPIMPLMWTSAFGAATVYLTAGLSSVVQFSAGLAFYRGAWHSLRNRSSNMDVLVALGISAAYGYSLISLAGLLGDGSPVFFETSAMLITFIRFGKWLEARAKGKASQALRELLDLQPQKARLLVKEREKEIPAALVEVGDHLLVKAGEKIPVDGEVIEGEAAVDESLLTGESLPVNKSPGNAVIGGTISRNGRLQIVARRIGSETALAQIVALVSSAQADKAPIQRLADRVSNIFVPTVVGLALLTFLSWYLLLNAGFLFAFQTSVAVLVIACPCALGLATPTAVMVGSAVGLQAGILFKTASVLENISRLKVILLDKTGTLTSGDFAVTDICPVGSVSDADLLQVAASLEAASNHPLAKAVVDRAQTEGFSLRPVSGTDEQGGHGLVGQLDGVSVAAGNARLMEQADIDLSVFAERAEALAADGKSLVYVARNGHLLGLLGLADSLKPDSVSAVAALRNLGLRTVLLTGDRLAVAKTVASEVGVDAVEAEVRPEQKLEVVRRFQQQGQLVGMVGDGINDAPALAAADVGIAVGGGTDVARETGDLVLVRGAVQDVERAIRLGRRTLGKIRQNLFWAFFYNLIGIPLAAGVFYPWFGWLLKPEFAGLAMAFSSVSVVTNSLLLKGYARRLEQRP